MPLETTAPALPAPVAAKLLERIERGTLELPVLPEVASQVVSQTGAEDCDVRVLADLVRRDQAMATHFLRIANSPLYLPKSKIVSLQQALARLGMRQVREIALMISVKTRTFQVRGYEAKVKELFQHSLGAGIFAQEIARKRRLNVEEAFLGGLLHDVGRPVLLQVLVDLHKELKLDANPEAVDAAVGEHHARVGGALVAAWSLPASLAETILHHHAPAGSKAHAKSAMITALADELAHFALSATPRDEQIVRSHPALEVLGLYPEDVDLLLGERDRVREMVAAIA